MTDDEVALIYDYLHENYEYVDGDIWRLKSMGNSKAGTSISTFHYNAKMEPRLRVKISVNKKIYHLYLSCLVYLWHTKKFEKYIRYLDNNPTNCKFENLKILDKYKCKNINIKRRLKKTAYGKYRAQLTCLFEGVKQKIYLGSYDDQKIAYEVRDFAKKIWIENNIDLNELKNQVLFKFPQSNMRQRSGNKTGFSNVCFQRGSYYYSFRLNKKRFYKAGFPTPEEAHAAYLKAKEEYKNNVEQSN